MLPVVLLDVSKLHIACNWSIVGSGNFVGVVAWKDVVKSSSHIASSTQSTSL